MQNNNDVGTNIYKQKLCQPVFEIFKPFIRKYVVNLVLKLKVLSINNLLKIFITDSFNWWFLVPIVIKKKQIRLL